MAWLYCSTRLDAEGFVWGGGLSLQRQGLCKEISVQVEEMAQLPKALVAFPRDPDLIPRIHVTVNSSSRWIYRPLLSSVGTRQSFLQVKHLPPTHTHFKLLSVLVAR